MAKDEASLSPDDPLVLVAEVKALQDPPAALAEEVISQQLRIDAAIAALLAAQDQRLMGAMDRLQTLERRVTLLEEQLDSGRHEQNTGVE